MAFYLCEANISDYRISPKVFAYQIDRIRAFWVLLIVNNDA